MIKIVDLHNDVLVERAAETQTVLVTASDVVLAVWTTRLQNPLVFLQRLGGIGKYRAVEDLHFVQSLADFETVKAFKPAYASLTWNFENGLAGGAHSDANLKPLGKQVIGWLEECGIALDAAHLNRKSFFDAAEISRKPIICSHTCFDGVYAHPRNLTNEQARIILESGGIIGLAFVSDFMGGGKRGIPDVLKQIDYFCSLFGEGGANSLAIGSDFYGSDNLALRDYEDIYQLKNGLIKLGYAEAVVDKIVYDNAYKFLNNNI